VDEPCPHADRETRAQHRDQAGENLQPASLQFVLTAQARDLFPQQLHFIAIAQAGRITARSANDWHGRDCNLTFITGAGFARS